MKKLTSAACAVFVISAALPTIAAPLANLAGKDASAISAALDGARLSSGATGLDLQASLPGLPEGLLSGPAEPLALKAQILLDRFGASPGVIDGIFGENVSKAVALVEAALGEKVDGVLDSQVWQAISGAGSGDLLKRHEITAEDLDYPFADSIPEDYSELARMERLAFTSPEEMLAERFHMDIDLLRTLNPDADFNKAGTTILVAAVEAEPAQGQVATIEVDKSLGQLRAFGQDGRLLVAYPATIGSSSLPSPSGTHEVKAIASEPVYYYDPENFQQGDNTEELQLPPGPNNPVGTVWIDLDKEGYGIHGTPEPAAIDKTYSHGCVRLTNWDAEELSRLVEKGVPVEFIE